jgi:hypothetical protein
MSADVFSGQTEDQTQCNLYKQCDIHLMTPQLCGPNAKSYGQKRGRGLDKGGWEGG